MLNVFAKSSILDAEMSSGYAFEVEVNKITNSFHGSNIAVATRYLKQREHFLFSVDFLLGLFC